MTAYGVYVHIPWCRVRCPYCAFNVVPERGADKQPYTRALLRQWEDVRHHFEGPPDTLYFGGGTPSLHPVPDLAALIRAVGPTGEVSLEANPGTVDGPLLDALLDAGVDRLSLGVQTFDARFARLLNRGHSVEQARDLLELVAARPFRSWSVDLMFALPGQRPEDVEAELDALLAAEPPHVSLYGLTIEPGTPFERGVALGRLTPPDEDAWADMMDRIVERLSAAGLERYEVSNFARPGHRSAHNEHYWRGRPYAGLGAGAHGLLPDGRRTVGRSDVSAFCEAPTDWEALEAPTPRQRATDLLLSTLRHIDGVPPDALATTGFVLDPEALRPLLRGGLLRSDAGFLRLAGAGWALADGLTARLVDALRPAPEPNSTDICSSDGLCSEEIKDLPPR